MEVKNRKAYFDYFIEEEYESGLVLLGTEIKSIRKGSVNLKDSYIRIKNDEAFVINMHISKYEEGNRFNHSETRERKLLLNKNEIKKLKVGTSQDGYNIIPLKMYIKNGRAKLLIGLAKGKKLYDKRAVIKERDLKREIKRV